MQPPLRIVGNWGVLRDKKGLFYRKKAPPPGELSAQLTEGVPFAQTHIRCTCNKAPLVFQGELDFAKQNSEGGREETILVSPSRTSPSHKKGAEKSAPP